MDPSSRLPHVVRFDVFELNLRSGELCQPGLKTRLQDKPLQILMLLLEHPGEVITREEIRKRLWADGCIVDFEHSINAAVKRLRAALGDDAEHPRYIETLPRHGYRLIVPVERLTANPTSSGAMCPGRPREEASDRFAARVSRIRIHWVAAMASGLMAALLGMLLFLNAGGLRDRLLTALGAPRMANTSPHIQSLAVLPLENLSSDPGQEYFADGMTDGLITDLSKLSQLRLISRTSVMRYKGTRKPLSQIARELNVDAVVEGAVLRSGNRVQITAQVIQANPEKHLWAERYERDLRDIISMQAELTDTIAREIRIIVTTAEKGRMSRTRPVDPEAYSLYLRGCFHNRQESETGYRKASEDFEQAVRRDPSYAPSYAELSLAYQEAGGWHSNLPFTSFHAQAREAALKALELDDDLAEAHIALGWVKFCEWDWEGALRELRRGMELNPTDTLARICYQCCLTVLGHFEESIAVGRQTIVLDPVSPEACNELGWALMYAGRDTEALEQFKKSLDLDPHFAQTHLLLAGFYVRNGMADRAVDHLRKTETFMDESRPPYWLGSLALYYRRAGKRADALRILDELETRSKTGYVSATALSRAHLSLDEKEKALGLLERAYVDHDLSLVWLKVDWRFDPLRSDPRFKNLLRRMNFLP